jgi:hypothetical protein
MPVFRRNAGDDEVRDPDPDVVQDELVTEERVDVVKPRWNVGTVLSTLCGAALTALGVAALVETGVNSTWYTPVESVLDINHTPLLAAIEIGVGVLLLLFGLAGARVLTALVCLAAAVAAGVAAVDPDQVQRELAIERWWAITLAASGLVLALLVMASRPARVERTYRSVPRGYGRAIPQH